MSSQMTAERQQFIVRIEEVSLRLGEATAQLKQLEAPRPEPQSRHVQTADETAQREAVVVEYAPAQAEAAPAPTASAAPTPASTPNSSEKERGFFARLFNSK